MSAVTRFQEQFNNDPKPGAFDWPQPTRCNTLPLPKRDIWVPQEQPHVPGQTPTRSIPLGSGTIGRQRARFQLPVEFWPESITPRFGYPATPQGDGYSSDEEDKRNGVPIRYSTNQGRPFCASLKAEVEAEFQRVKAQLESHITTLRKREDGWRTLRQLFAKNLGLDWTEPQWAEFLSLEASFFDLQDKIFALQNKLEENNAQMYLFVGLASSSLGTRPWMQQGDVKLWSLEGAAEQSFTRDGEYPVLEWRGVDYNKTERTYEYYQKFSSLTSIFVTRPRP